MTRTRKNGLLKSLLLLAVVGTIGALFSNKWLSTVKKVPGLKDIDSKIGENAQ